MRITRDFIERRFEAWKKEMGFEPGELQLDFNSVYGGYFVEQVLPGGVRVANGYRMGNRALLAWMEGALFAHQRLLKD